MITVLTGENDYELRQAVQQLIANFDGAPERFDGSELDLGGLPDLLMGTSLFSTTRLVIIDRLSDSPVWSRFDEWLDRVSEGIHLVLVEPKPDKRTKTYKDLLKKATVREFPAWTNKDQIKAVEWAIDYASARDLKLTREQSRHLVARTGVDQWRLHHAIDKLALAGEITTSRIDQIVEPSPEENVFALFETALRGEIKKLEHMVHTLSQSEDPYRVFGLLTSQALQLAALVLGGKPSKEVASDIKAAPFVLTKLAPFAKKLAPADVKRIISEAAESDHIMKSSSVDPWVAVERFLLKIAP